MVPVMQPPTGEPPSELTCTLRQLLPVDATKEQWRREAAGALGNIPLLPDAEMLYSSDVAEIRAGGAPGSSHRAPSHAPGRCCHSPDYR